MTSPLVVGQVAVEVQASARGFAKSLRDAVVKEFKGAGLDKALSDALGKAKVKVPVQPVVDDKTIPSAPRVPKKAPAGTDPLLKAFQQDVQRQLRALAKQTLKIPVEPDTEALRRGISDALDKVRKTARAEIPVEPGDRQEYERSLRAMLSEVTSKVKVSLPAPEIKQPKPIKVPVQVDPLLNAFQQQIRREANTLARRIQVQIPVTPETESLRRQLGAQLAELQRQSRITVPVEPGSRVEYEARLRSMLASAQRSVPPIRQNVRVDVDRASLRRAESALSGLASAARGLGGAVGTLGKIGAIGASVAVGLAGLASAAGGAVQLLVGLAGAAITASGALFALPGAAAIAGAGIGALALGFLGVTDAIKEGAKASSDGGASIADAARQTVQAQRSLEGAERSYQAALRESRRAQEDLTRARKAAIERIEDLGRAVRGALLDEEEAAFRVADAKLALEEATVAGVGVDRATNALKQAELAAENAKDAAGDLADEQVDAARRGVNASDEVLAALDRQQSAADSLASATDALASAQEALDVAQSKSAGGLSAAALAMARLSPAAQDVVRTLLALKPAWEDMQRSVQQTLFTGVSGDLTRLSSSILPTVQAGFVGLAGVLNGQLRAALAELSTANSRIQLDTVFKNAKAALDGLSVAVRPLIQAFLDVSAVGSQIVKDQTSGLGKLIADVSTRLSALAKSGELTTIINNGLDVLKSFGAAAGDVFGIVKGIFTAVPEGGGGLFALLDRLNALVNSVQGQNALTELFTNLSAIGTALTPVLLAVAQALGPVTGAIAQIATAAAPVLAQVATTLGGALASLAPAFISLLPLVSAFASGLQPLANILVGLVTSAAPGLTIFVQGLVAGLTALVPAAAPVGQALGAIAQAIAPLLPVLGAQLANVLTILATVISGAMTEITPLIGVFGEIASTAAGELLPVILQLARQLLPVMAQAGVEIARAFTPLIPVIAEIARIFAEKLAAALPGLVASFASILPSVIDLAGALGGALLAALQAIIPQLPQLIDAGLQLVQAFLDLFAALYPVLPQLLELGVMLLQAMLNGDLLTNLMKAMTLAILVSVGAIRNITSVVGFLKDAFNTVTGAVGKMGGAVKDGAVAAYNAIKDVRDKIVNTITGIAGTLFDAGKNLINGLINGIKSAFGALQSVLNWVTDRIPDWKGPASKDAKLLRPAGTSIMQGLIGSIHAERTALRDELAAVTSDINVGGAIGLDSLGAASLSAPSPIPIEMRFTGDHAGSFFEWVRDNTRIYHGGSAQAAFGSG